MRQDHVPSHLHFTCAIDLGGLHSAQSAEIILDERAAELGITPDMVAGHSYGELAALQAAGAYSPADLVALSSRRALCILDAADAAPDHGSMAAVRGAPAEIEPHIVDIQGVVIANLNSGEQTVISGTTQAVTDAVKRLSDAGLAARTLDVACAFHSPVVAAASILWCGGLHLVVPVQEEVGQSVVRVALCRGAPVGSLADVEDIFEDVDELPESPERHQLLDMLTRLAELMGVELPD